jgi:hypothetical protein
MVGCYYNSPEVAKLQVLLDEATRARPGSDETRFILPEGGLMDRLESRFHHVVYGRRGTGKSSLLRRSQTRFAQRGSLTAWADQETYMALSYPDVLVGTLGDVFAQFATQLRTTAPRQVKPHWWSKPQPSDHEVLARDLEELVAQLVELKRAPSKSEVEWTVTSSQQLAATLTGDVGGQLTKGPVQLKGGRSNSKSSSQAFGSDVTQKYLADKTEHLEKALASYRAMMTRVTALVPDAFVILDDFYRLASVDQPRIAGYFHRAVKDTGVWLKFGTIRYWTRLYAGGQPAMGLQAPHDIIELSLDRGLLDFKKSKKFLEEILGALANECEVEIPRLFSDGALGGWCRTRVSGWRSCARAGWSLGLAVRVGRAATDHAEYRWPCRGAGGVVVAVSVCWTRVSERCVVHPVAAAHPDPGVLATLSTARRARLTAAASRAKSAAILVVPRTRARRPPWRRRIRWPILRSTFGRVAR